MSEVKLNLIAGYKGLQVLHGRIHGSVADACVAALSAEPETIAELASALARYIKPLNDHGPFATFHSSIDSANRPQLDTEPWDAGIVIIDLAARIIASESIYSTPEPSGEVYYHDGTASTDIPVHYRLPDDWLFVNSIDAYKWSRERRTMKRARQPALDARTILNGHPLLEFIADAISDLTTSTLWNESPLWSAPTCRRFGPAEGNTPQANYQLDDAFDEADDPLAKEISAIHARWLMTPREDLRGQSPRDLMLAKRNFIDCDLDSRSFQWTLQNEGPPCLPPDSFAYLFAGFGTHEWVIYYDLVRHLLWSALETVRQTLVCRCRRVTDAVQSGEYAADFTAIDSSPVDSSRFDLLIAQLEDLKSAWLEQPHPDYDGRIPAILLDNERKRLPIALRPRDMIIDEDCPMCRMFGDETTPLGMGVGFWHLDGCNMDDDFAFSWYRTREEWEAENHRREEFDKEFTRKMEERRQRLARGEPLEPDPYFDLDPFPFDGLEATLLASPSSDEDDEDLTQ